MSLIEKAKFLDNFLDIRYLEKEYTREIYDLKGWDYEGIIINTEDYVTTFFSADGYEYEVKMNFEKYQENKFRSTLNEIKESFRNEYSLSLIPLAEKIAYGTSFKEHLENKLEKFRNHKIGKKYSTLLLEFINEFSIEFVDVIDTKSKNSSFYFLKTVAHRDTLNKLYRITLKEGLISSDTKQLTFLKLFDNLEVQNRVTWIGSTSELKYFIKLINKTELGFEDKGVYKWRIAVKCFVKVSVRSLKEITYKDLRTYKITDNTNQKLDRLLLNAILPV
ncbi:hypothetical protein [Polaribacter dokdonensis]|uniref:hypothetical protein n=1 Tax=Polaribacter dokdonensis TaxID=326329 RepID=UPI0006B5C4E6|nr:hypothetical protein [Polaribacter dokdonensis]